MGRIADFFKRKGKSKTVTPPLGDGLAQDAADKIKKRKKRRKKILDEADK